MNIVRLPGTDITTTRLGFGCAKLMRIPSRSGRQRVLAKAYEAGIRHFDVARMYGLGAAERDLGAFARGKRPGLVLATKFGIELNARGKRLGPVQGLARRLVAWFPVLRRLARRGAEGLYEARRYDSEHARESLETSLRELGTDYVDLFLLHEPTLPDIRDSDILEFLERQRRLGKVRAYGISGSTEDVLAIRDEVPRLAPVIQMPNDAVGRHIDRISRRATCAVITYSPLSHALPLVAGHLRSSRETRRRWSEAIGVDCGSVDDVAALLLRYCVAANERGVVLFSTTKPHRVLSAVRTACSISEEVDTSLRALLELVDAEIVPVETASRRGG